MLDRRIPLVPTLPTPLQPMDRLAEVIGLPAGGLWVKRDDLTGLAGGGNKVRKLEYLCADALAQGCDVLVTGGGPQSNHARLTVAAANTLGLASRVVLTADEPSVPSGNVVLDELLGADIVWVGVHDFDGAEAAIEAACDELTAEGHVPYRMPIGGASTVGALGYVTAAIELHDQLPEVGTVVVADGSGGTHAGLVAGLGDHALVLGVDVGARPDLRERVQEKAAAAATLADLPAPVGTVRLDVDRIGTGYGALTAGAREALDLAARREGLLLDPVYTAKAMAGLLAGVREGRIDTDTPVVFLHTGGLPAVFAAGVPEWLRAGDGADR